MRWRRSHAAAPANSPIIAASPVSSRSRRGEAGYITPSYLIDRTTIYFASVLRANRSRRGSQDTQKGLGCRGVRSSCGEGCGAILGARRTDSMSGEQPLTSAALGALLDCRSTGVGMPAVGLATVAVVSATVGSAAVAADAEAVRAGEQVAGHLQAGHALAERLSQDVGQTLR